MEYLVTCLVSVLFIMSALPVRADNFVPYTDNVPVMDGFSVSTDDILVFDKPEGRVSEVMLWCHQPCPAPAEIYAFYSGTLQKLGWVKRTNQVYQNDQTNLSIQASQDQNKSDTVIIIRTNG